MSAKECYDYVSTISADYDYTLTIKPQGEIEETSPFDTICHIGVDNSEERINFGNTRTFILSWDWKLLNESDSGTIFELYNDSKKANKGLNSFYVTYGDGHTYVCRFDCALKRKGNSVNRYGINGVVLKILGRKADA